MKIGNRIFDAENNVYIMGILNVTPDSFSDGGKYASLDKALKHCEEMIEEGADIIDIGGESTRPNYKKISDEEEIRRVCPVIEGIKARFDIPLSVDTYKSAVAKAALSAGADLLNDIWGLKYDGKTAEIIKEFQVPCCLMHNRKEAVYNNFIDDVISDLAETLEIADRAGIERNKIILDPGVGFGKDYKQNLTIIRELQRLKVFGLPILLGTSRKSVIGLALNLPSDQRVEGTAATTVIGAMKGAAFFRVHDVAANKRALAMTEAILKDGLN